MDPGSGAAAGALPGVRVAQTTGTGPGGPAGAAPVPSGGNMSHIPLFSSEPGPGTGGLEFLQSPSRPPHQHQGQTGTQFPPQAGMQQGFTGGPLRPGTHPAPGVLPGVMTRPRLPGLAGPTQGQVRPAGLGAGMTPSHPGVQCQRFGHDSSSSSPSTPLPPSFPCSSSGSPASLVQLYSEIIPDDKPKKRRNRKKDGDETAGEGNRTPLSQHSDDITAPPTPAVSDTSCSTPTHQSDLSFPPSSCSGLAPSSELERQLSVSSAAQQRASVLGMESQRGPLSVARLEVKVCTIIEFPFNRLRYQYPVGIPSISCLVSTLQEEREESRPCGGGVVKMEDGGVEGLSSPSPLHGGDAGKELLRHLLKDKTSPATTPSPTRQGLPTVHRPLSNESIRSEEEDSSYSNMVRLLRCYNNFVFVFSVRSADVVSCAFIQVTSPGMDGSSKKKTQRNKRPARPDKDKAPPKYKRRKKMEEDKGVHSSSEPLMTHLRQVEPPFLCLSPDS